MRSCLIFLILRRRKVREVQASRLIGNPVRIRSNTRCCVFLPQEPPTDRSDRKVDAGSPEQFQRSLCNKPLPLRREGARMGRVRRPAFCAVDRSRGITAVQEPSLRFHNGFPASRMIIFYKSYCYETFLFFVAGTFHVPCVLHEAGYAGR